MSDDKNEEDNELLKIKRSCELMEESFNFNNKEISNFMLYKNGKHYNLSI